MMKSTKYLFTTLAMLLIIFQLQGQPTAKYPIEVINDVEYYTYEVKAGEGLYSICKRFDVQQATINRLNPQITSGLRAGQVILIPKIHKKTTSTTDKLKYHNVKAKETLFAISRQYQVSQESIIQANPSIAQKGLLKGTVIKIPLLTSTDNNKIQETTRPKTKKQKYKIAYLLPFMANEKTINPTAKKFIEFYIGSLLAINNAKNRAINYEIFTFDIEKSETKLYETINQPELQDMDLIFGPAYTLQIPILADFAKRRKIYTVVPFSSNVEHIASNPYLFQFNPDEEYQQKRTFNLVKNRFQTANILFVNTNSNKTTNEYNMLKKQLRNAHIKYQEVKIQDLTTALHSNKKNLIIFDTNNYPNVKQTLSVLYDIDNEFDLYVLGQYAWRGRNGKKPKTIYISPFIGNTKGTMYYEQEYKKYYGNTQPITNPRFDLLGYDLTTYFLSTMQADGFSFSSTPSKNTLYFDNGVQSDFIFQKSNMNGGYINQQLYIIEDEAESN